MSEKCNSPSKQYEAALNEISLLRDKLDSKSCALIILSQELLECKAQRDQFKLMGEQLRDRYSVMKRKMEGLGPALTNVYGNYMSEQHQQYLGSPSMDGSNMLVSMSMSRGNISEPLTQLLVTLKEQNKHLIREIDDLRMKLEDAEGDLKIVRGQMRAMSHHIDATTSSHNLDRASPAYERERDRERNLLVGELEFSKNKIILLERDLQALLDEKEELILSRDSYKMKVDRLNEKLNELMRNGGTSEYDVDVDGKPHPINVTSDQMVMDIDSIVMENRYLKERIKVVEEEKVMANQRLVKYKDLMENKSRMNTSASTASSGLGSLGFTSNTSSNGSSSKDLNASTFASATTIGSISSSTGLPNLISARQVEQLIASDALNQLEVSPSSLAHLRSLVIALFEGLQDKSTGLTHAKKTNKLLGKRIEELEKQLKNLHIKDREKFQMQMQMHAKQQQQPQSQMHPQNLALQKNDSVESSSSSVQTNTTTNVSTPDDLDEDDYVQSERDVDADDEEALPPELDKLVQDAMRELRESDATVGISASTHASTQAAINARMNALSFNLTNRDNRDNRDNDRNIDGNISSPNEIDVK